MAIITKTLRSKRICEADNQACDEAHIKGASAIRVVGDSSTLHM